MATQVDLKQLAVERHSTDRSVIARKRARLTRWGVPLFIIGGFVAIVGWSARDHWLPAKPVTVVPVVISKAELQHAGTPMFQAAGWIEPRPTATMCSALVEGVVDELLVVEGQEVRKGDPVAKLIDADARISLQEAESIFHLREAELDGAKAALTAARQNVEQPVQLEASHAEAEASLATLETEIKNLPFLIKAAKARMDLARQELEGKKIVGDAIAGRLLQKSQSEFDAAAATLAELEQRGPNLTIQKEAWQRRCEALHTRLKLKTEEHRALNEAQANSAAVEARVAQARLGIESARLRLDRMVVRAPISGRVLTLHAQPGRRLMGINAASERDASIVVTLYDPNRLQIRADVRLEDVPQVSIGQPVQITTASASDPLSGTVLAMTSQADIQKNTLQVKVSIDDPSASIRPEMLAQVVFLSPEERRTGSEDEQPLRLLVAKELVERAENNAAVWVADLPHGVARRKTVQVGRAATDQLVEITNGLTALDKLIVMGREGLADGARIRVVGNDRTVGASKASKNHSTKQSASSANSNPPIQK